MASSELTSAGLVRLMRAMVKESVQQAMAKTRTPSTLTGTVEELDEDLDVAWVRMDQEAMGGDPTQSDNFEMPGVIPTTRLGETFTGDQARVSFDAAAGASATRTSTENVIVLPFGAESGRRIIADGNTGRIEFYDEDDNLVSLLDTDRWVLGDIETPGAVVQLDPIGGFTIRSADNELVTIIDQNGYSLRDGVTGLVVAEVKGGSFRLVDPVGTDDIEMTTTSSGTLSSPAYRSAVEVSPGASLTSPAAPLFTSTPADDIEIAHVAAWIRATQQSATMSPPAGTWAEQQDENFDHAVAGTLQTSVATRDVAVGTTGDFTSTQSNWQHAVGTRVVIRGGGASSPAFRSISYAETATAGATATPSITKPAGTASGDILVTFVSLGVNGGSIPSGWVTPDGFVFLGANFSTSGSGSTQSTVASGAWVKLAGASEPATYETTINLPQGTKLIAASMVAISNPWLNPGGVQIRMAGKPIRRLLAQTKLAAASATLCDFQNISQAYDNLEVVYDGLTDLNGGTGNIRTRMRYNADSGATNYAYQITETEGVVVAVNTSTSSVASSRILLGGLSDTDNAGLAGRINIYGYATSGTRKVSLGQGYWAAAGGTQMRNGLSYVGQYNPGSAINRITIEADTTPNRFKAGSRAYLYGY